MKIIFCFLSALLLIQLLLIPTGFSIGDIPDTSALENLGGAFNTGNSETMPLIAAPASEESHDSYNTFINEQQLKEEIYFTMDTYNKTEFAKNENVSMKFGVMNRKLYAINNVTILAEIPVPLEFNRTSIYIETIKDEKTISSENIQKISKLDNGSKYFIYLGKINSYEFKFVRFNIKTNISGKYVLNPSTLFYKDQYGANKSIQSQPVYFSIINHKPIITRIRVSPSPARKRINGDLNGQVTFNAVFEDNDVHDLKKCELWSSIDGSLNETYIVQQQRNTYNYKYIIYYLSEGIHTITFKVFDKDDDCTEEDITLTVDEYAFNIIPRKYDWAIFISILSVFIAIFLKVPFRKLICCKKLQAAVILFFIILFISGYISIMHLGIYLFFILLAFLIDFKLNK